MFLISPTPTGLRASATGGTARAARMAIGDGRHTRWREPPQWAEQGASAPGNPPLGVMRQRARRFRRTACASSVSAITLPGSAACAVHDPGCPGVRGVQLSPAAPTRHNCPGWCRIPAPPTGTGPAPRADGPPHISPGQRPRGPSGEEPIGLKARAILSSPYEAFVEGHLVFPQELSILLLEGPNPVVLILPLDVPTESLSLRGPDGKGAPSGSRPGQRPSACGPG